CSEQAIAMAADGLARSPRDHGEREVQQQGAAERRSPGSPASLADRRGELGGGLVDLNDAEHAAAVAVAYGNIGLDEKVAVGMQADMLGLLSLLVGDSARVHHQLAVQSLVELVVLGELLSDQLGVSRPQ